MEIWHRFYDSGTWEVIRPTPTTVRATLSGFSIADALYCLNLQGYFQRMFELVGALDVTVRHPECRASGHAHCRYDGGWR